MITRNVSTPESRAFWAFVGEVSKHVRATEPYWFTAEQRAAYWAAVDRGERDPLCDFREGA